MIETQMPLTHKLQRNNLTSNKKNKAIRHFDTIFLHKVYQDKDPLESKTCKNIQGQSKIRLNGDRDSFLRGFNYDEDDTPLRHKECSLPSIDYESNSQLEQNKQPIRQSINLKPCKTYFQERSFIRNVELIESTKNLGDIYDIIDDQVEDYESQSQGNESTGISMIQKSDTNGLLLDFKNRLQGIRNFVHTESSPLNSKQIKIPERKLIHNIQPKKRVKPIQNLLSKGLKSNERELQQSLSNYEMLLNQKSAFYYKQPLRRYNPFESCVESTMTEATESSSMILRHGQVFQAKNGFPNIMITSCCNEDDESQLLTDESVKQTSKRFDMIDKKEEEDEDLEELVNKGTKFNEKLKKEIKSVLESQLSLKASFNSITDAIVQKLAQIADESESQ